MECSTYEAEYDGRCDAATRLVQVASLCWGLEILIWSPRGYEQHTSALLALVHTKKCEIRITGLAWQVRPTSYETRVDKNIIDVVDIQRGG